ncbi:MAG: pilus assembly protein TadG-related protein, partial [Phycisphaerae bacterium]
MLTLVMMVVLLGFASLTIDVGIMYHARSELQDAADAAAMAAANAHGVECADEDPEEYSNGCHSRLYAVAQRVAMANHSEGVVLPPEGLVAGHWDEDTQAFAAWGTPVNAFRAGTFQTSSNGNPVQLTFAAIFGHNETDVRSTGAAIAFIPSSEPGVGGRFLLDDEMFDSDVPEIEDLADSLGVSPDDMITD